MADWKGGTTDQADPVRDMAAKLVLCGVPSIHAGRDSASDLSAYIELCDTIVRRGILPVIQLHPGDPAPPMRNLMEVCCLGILTLKWSDGGPSFDWEKLYETIDGAGRYRLLLDFALDFGAKPPEPDSISPHLPRLEALARKYGHIQAIKLEAFSGNAGDLKSAETVKGIFQAILKACPSAKAAASPKIWNEIEMIRDLADDLSMLEVEIDPNDSKSQDCASDALKPLTGVPDLDFVPRLPLLKTYYRKGWFSFEVGKVLDSWVGKKAFKYYSERPAWL
jgi:hypothetical protein